MPLNTPIDNRPVPGSNEAPDFAKQVSDRLAEEYRGFYTTLDELKAEIPKLPEQVKSDADALMVGALIKRFRDLDSRVEAVRVLEKEPYLRGGNAVDSTFFGLRDQIGKRNKSDRSAKPGFTDALQGRINVYQDEKIAAEQARLLAERQAAQRAAHDAALKAEEERQAAEQARLAAERARKPETTAAKSEAAHKLEQEAMRQQVEAQKAAELAEDARLAALVKPADIARTRGNAASGGGVTLTVARDPYAILEDRMKLDMAKLWPFFTDAEIEKALRAWARSTGYRVAMDGASIGVGNKGVTR